MFSNKKYSVTPQMPAPIKYFSCLRSVTLRRCGQAIQRAIVPSRNRNTNTVSYTHLVNVFRRNPGQLQCFHNFKKQFVLINRSKGKNIILFIWLSSVILLKQMIGCLQLLFGFKRHGQLFDQCAALIESPSNRL